MSEQLAIFLAREGLKTALFVCGPVLAVGLVVGLVVAVLQAVTSIREFTLIMIAKILAVGLTVFVLAPWMLKLMVAYTASMVGMRILLGY